MPNTREKLINLLRQTRYEYRRYIAMKDYEKRIAKTDEEFLAVDDSIVGEIPFCADYLIAHGVTVQEWIPVSEPPKKGEYDWVLVQIQLIPECTWGVPERAEYKNGVFRDIQGRPLNTKYERVTHWMPLPKPPKGE